MMTRRSVSSFDNSHLPQARSVSKGRRCPSLVLRACGTALLAVVGWFVQADHAPACSLCPTNGKISPTFREDAALATAKIILHGTISNPRLVGDGFRGQTDFAIKTVLRPAPAIKGKDKLVLDRYLPLNKGETPHMLLF